MNGLGMGLERAEAIEKARARGKQLYVAFVDLSNAFPSVDQATLWTKLYTAGFRGPLFDWLRMLYARLGYVVKYASSKSELFKALAGILIGDPASPILWNLYLADLVIRPHSDDILLGGVCLSHLEQADDIALFSTSTIALQQKLDDLATWCALNFALINAGKTQVMVFGRTGAATLGGPPRLYVNGRLIAVVESYTYVGTVFSSGRGDLFGPHTDSKASTARKVANACLSVEAYVAELPPWAALTLYQSHVDPHLTGGAEVAPYVRLSSLTLLESVQHIYLRRMLGLNPRAMTTPLFTETGLWPIRYRRLALALRFALYIISQRPPVPLAALAEARAMAIAGADSWLGDLHHALQSLPVPVEMDKHAALTADYISNMLERLRISLVEHLRQEIASSQRLVMLAARASQHRT
ncbi:hypothetical protein EVJ58_g9917 [Rhodofomes roseus]|uniref:Reverse transcriptase domain-containing protein n=1 Tax=Rhodofomes roseus TaxID=34475 RepID=A0A4Y9XTA8_9APHY|nr:hypothetical protein EVJ58_g9917 [Rhodofomes roseus]